MNKFPNNVIIIILIFLLLPSQLAYAYLDPGTGSIVLQTVIALLVLIIAFIKNFWTKVKISIVKLLGLLGIKK